jgi:hypothetical protein
MWEKFLRAICDRVKAIPQDLIFQYPQGKGLSHPLQLGMLPSMLPQLLYDTDVAVQIFNTLRLQ